MREYIWFFDNVGKIFWTAGYDSLIFGKLIAIYNMSTLSNFFSNLFEYPCFSLYSPIFEKRKWKNNESVRKR